MQETALHVALRRAGEQWVAQMRTPVSPTRHRRDNVSRADSGGPLYLMAARNVNNGPIYYAIRIGARAPDTVLAAMGEEGN